MKSVRKKEIGNIQGKISSGFMNDRLTFGSRVVNTVMPIESQLKPQNIFRPITFSEYIGQEDAKAVIQDNIKSAVIRKAPMEHMLISSAGPGAGKSTIARIISYESKRELIETTASSLEKPADIFSLFKRANRFVNPIIFIDEIHNLKHSLAELIYMPMEDYGASIPLNEELGDGRMGTLTVNPFTLIGATAGEQGKLPKPFIDKFDLKIVLQPYTDEEIYKIVGMNAKKISIMVCNDAVKELSLRSCRNPRIGNSLLKRVRDYAIARNIRNVTHKMSLEIFKTLGIDELGLDNIGRMILKSLYTSRKKRLGLSSLSQSVRLDIKTIQILYEPQLLTHDLIAYLPNGRGLTELGEEHVRKHETVA